MKRLNYYIGRWFESLGYRVQPIGKVPICNMNLLAVSALAFRSNTIVNLVQVGAFDGDHADPVKEVIELLGGGVRAILLEPQPDAFRRLQERYCGKTSVQPVEAALANFDGEITLHVPESESLRTMASTRDGFLAGRASKVKEIVVPSISYPTLLQRYGISTVDLLQIDAEGADADLVDHVLACDESIQPLVIHFEIGNLSVTERAAVRQRLSTCGYSLCEGPCDALAVKDLSILARDR